MKRYDHKPVFRPDGASDIGLRVEKHDSEEAQVDFSEIWETIREGKWLILLTCVVVTGAIAAFTMSQTPIYQASSIVEIHTPPERSASQMMGVSGGRDLSVEIGVLQYSADLSERVAGRLKDTAEAMESDDAFPVLLDDQGEMVSDRKAGQRILEKTTFSPISQRNMIQISVRSEMPAEASTIANLYAEEYKKFSQEKSRASVAAARKFLEEQLAKRVKEIRDLERQWENFARENDVITEGEGGSRVVQEYMAMQSRRNELEFQLEQDRQKLDILKTQLNQFEPELREQVTQEQGVAELQGQVEAINEKIVQLKADAEPYYVNNPELKDQSVAQIREQGYSRLAENKEIVQSLENRKSELTGQLVEKASNAMIAAGGEQNGALARIGQLRSRIMEQELTIDQLESQVAAVDKRSASYDSELQSIPSQRLERKRLEQKLAQAEQFRNSLVSQLQGVIMEEESELGFVRQVRSAFVPTAPVSPNVRQNIILGILLGLGFGVGLAFLRRAVADRLSSPEDVQDRGYSLVGVIPDMSRELTGKLKGRDTVEVDGRAVSTRLLPIHDPWSSISENYRLIRTNLQHTKMGSPPKVTLITSPEQGDGKTLTAVNLAITMAQSGKRTIIVDADLRRPNTHRLLGVNREQKGVAEILRTSDAIPDYVVPTSVDRLHLLPAGMTDKPPAEMLGSERMEHLLDHLRAHYDIIIIDTPPILAVSDPLLVSTYADATLMVVAADTSSIEAVRVAEKTLGSVGVPISGVVLNRYAGGKSRYKYEYGYDSEYRYQLEEG